MNIMDFIIGNTIVVICLSTLWVAYIFAYFFFKSKVKLPRWIIWFGGIALFAIWSFWVANRSVEKEEAQNKQEYDKIDTDLKDYLSEKLYDYSSMSKIPQINIDKELDGKIIAITRDEETTKIKVQLESKLNDRLKKENKYTTNPDSLDYVVIILPYWKTDSYGTMKNVHSHCEMANVIILDYKADTIAGTIVFNENKNPDSITVKRNSPGEDRYLFLEADELYDGIVKNRHNKK